MVLLDQLWDDVVAGPKPERGLKHLKKNFTTKPLNIKGKILCMTLMRFIYMSVWIDIGEGSGNNKYQRSLSMPASPGTPSPTAARRDNVWRSVFHPGSNLATKGIGSSYFDKPQPNSPTVYDWLYSEETRSKHH